MRTLEVVLLASVVLGVAWLAGPWRTSRPMAAIVTVAVGAAVVAQPLVEQARWQLVPLYVGVAVILLAGAGTLLRRPRRLRLPRTVALVVLVLSGVFAASAWALPVTVLPEPAGPAPVGTVTFSLAAPEQHGDPAVGMARSTRTLVGQVWYPATADTVTAYGPWVNEPADIARATADELGLPTFALGHLGLVRSHATPEARPALDDGPLPLVVYIHGRTGFRGIHASLLESLASHGYAVVAVDHALGPLATTLADGSVQPHDADVLPAEVIAKKYEQASAQLIDTYADDIALLLDHLDTGAIASLAGDLDLHRVALIGYSAGGGAAILACARQVSCGAAVGYDPWVEPLPDEVVGAGLDVPLLSIRSEEWVGGSNDRRLRRLHAATGFDEGRVVVTGTTHRDLTVLPLLSPLTELLGVSGDTPGPRTHAIVDTWTVRFLDRHLRGRGIDPLRTPPPFPEAVLDSNG